MIISDKHKFVFVHIPKCAGSSVRKRLEGIDGVDSSFAGNADHSDLGRIDLAHLPLSVLRQHFTEVFEKIRQYESFGIIRDPYQRFPSSVIQRLRLYGTTPVEVLSRRDLAGAVDDTINFLSGSRSSELLPHDFSHFHRQHAFVFVDNVQVTRELFTLTDVSGLFARIAEIVGEPIDGDHTKKKTHENKSEFFESDFAARVAAYLLPFYTDSVKKRLPTGFRKFLQQRFLVDPATKYGDIFHSDHVRQFVGDYYSDDIELFERVSSAPQQIVNDD